MTMSSIQTPKVERIASLAGPLFSLMIVLRRARDLDTIPDLQVTVVRLIEEFRHRATDCGIPSQTIQDATYAQAATFDEFVLSQEWSGRDGWMENSLAKRYCNNEFVGIGFYEKLAQLRNATPPRKDVVEVFYYCLLAGFAGQYLEKPDEREKLRLELAAELSSFGDARLVPDESGGRTEVVNAISSFPMLWVVSVAVAVVILFWVVTSFILDGRADSVVQILERLRG
jgi:type VI secretion system protein ImpK